MSPNTSRQFWSTVPHRSFLPRLLSLPDGWRRLPFAGEHAAAGFSMPSESAESRTGGQINPALSLGNSSASFPSFLKRIAPCAAQSGGGGATELKTDLNRRTISIPGVSVPPDPANRKSGVSKTAIIRAVLSLRNSQRRQRRRLLATHHGTHPDCSNRGLKLFPAPRARLRDKSRSPPLRSLPFSMPPSSSPAPYRRAQTSRSPAKSGTKMTKDRLRVTKVGRTLRTSAVTTLVCSVPLLPSPPQTCGTQTVFPSFPNSTTRE